MNQFDSEEKTILKAVASDKLKPSRVGPVSWRVIAKRRRPPSAKRAVATSVHHQKDLRTLRKRALAEGVPDQTPVSSVLDKFVEGQMV